MSTTALSYVVDQLGSGLSCRKHPISCPSMDLLRICGFVEVSNASLTPKNYEVNISQIMQDRAIVTTKSEQI